jgi:hypothetical protein
VATAAAEDDDHVNAIVSRPLWRHSPYKRWAARIVCTVHSSATSVFSSVDSVFIRLKYALLTFCLTYLLYIRGNGLWVAHYVLKVLLFVIMRISVSLAIELIVFSQCNWQL